MIIKLLIIYGILIVIGCGSNIKREAKAQNKSIQSKGNQMIELWSKYETWLKKNYPDGFKSLNKGATEEELVKLEYILQIKLPESYRNCLKLHNGQSQEYGGILDTNEFLSIERIIDEWKLMKGLLDDGEFPSDSIWWSIKWVPITSDGNGNLICINMQPFRENAVGSVIVFDHEVADRALLEYSFENWFKAYVSELLAEKYVYSEDYGSLMPKVDL